ncbi:MAG: hypothetical protein ACK56I_06945, partial [bacterium]
NTTVHVFPFWPKYCGDVLSYQTKTYHVGTEDGQRSLIKTPDFFTFNFLSAESVRYRTLHQQRRARERFLSAG